MGRELLLKQLVPFDRDPSLFPLQPQLSWSYPALALLSKCYSRFKGTLLTCSSPVRRSTRQPKSPFALDLHVLGTPPAFVLSQDQTLQLIPIEGFSSASAEYPVRDSKKRIPAPEPVSYSKRLKVLTFVRMCFLQTCYSDFRE